MALLDWSAPHLSKSDRVVGRGAPAMRAYLADSFEQLQRSLPVGAVATGGA